MLLACGSPFAWIGQVPEKRLVKQILLVRVRRFQIIHAPFPAAIRRVPVLQRTSPKLRHFRNRDDPGAHIFAAFCIVRGGREQARRPIALSVKIPLVKSINAQSELLRLAAHFV